MTVNPVAIRQRSKPFNKSINANGSYTLPQQGFVPAAGTRPLAENSGNVPANNGHASNPGFIAAANVDTSQLPGANYARASGVRIQTAQIQVNTSVFANK